MSIEAHFEIVIDFNQGSGDPARIFRAMSGLISSFQYIDKHLVSAIDVSMKVDLVLEDVEKGSLKASFRNFIEEVPDEALRNAEWKKIIGHFLVHSKLKILEWCADKDKVSNWNEIKSLADELRLLVEEQKREQLTSCTPISVENLLSDISRIQGALNHLEGRDRAIYKYDNKMIEFNRDLEVTREVVKEVAKLFVKDTSKKILRVTKTDYEGQSMWGFLLDGRDIEAKISIAEWVHQFQSRRLIVSPGDTIKVELYEELTYGYDGEVLNRYYEVEKVYEVYKA